PGRRDEAAARHAAYFLARCSAWAEQAQGGNVSAAISRLAQERENLAGVLERALSCEPSVASATDALRAVAALAPLYIGRMPLGPYRSQVEAALAMAGKFEGRIAGRLVVEALLILGQVHVVRGAATLGQSCYERAAAIAECASDPSVTALSLFRLATAHGEQG